jgi:hypothetical protein
MKRYTQLFIAVLFFFVISCREQTKVETASTAVVVHLTAENGKPLGPEIKYMPEWKAFGWFTAKDSVEWEADIPAAGEYNVRMEWSVSDEDAGKEFILIADKDQLTGIVDKSGSWETYKTKDVGSINLEQGKQKFIFRSNTKFDEGAILDLRSLKLERK